MKYPKHKTSCGRAAWLVLPSKGKRRLLVCDVGLKEEHVRAIVRTALGGYNKFRLERVRAGMFTVSTEVLLAYVVAR